jgi:hypothetical protein
MTPTQWHTRQAPGQSIQQAYNDPPPSVGRPQGAPSTILNLRLPLGLLSRLDRFLDYLEVHTGLKANRGMIARRALELFLETYMTDDNAPRTQEAQHESSGQVMPIVPCRPPALRLVSGVISCQVVSPIAIVALPLSKNLPAGPETNSPPVSVLG